MAAQPRATSSDRRDAPDTLDAFDALDALGVGVVAVNGDWRITYTSPAWTAMIGEDAGASVGRPLADACPPMAGANEQALAQATMADGMPRSFRVEHTGLRDGGVVDVRVTRTRRGSLVFEMRDASALVTLERDFDGLLESIGEPIFVVDESWRVTYWNGAAERQVGATRDDVLGKVLWDRFPHLAGTPVERAYRQTMTTREPQHLRDYRFPGHRGSGRGAGYYDARSFPVAGGGLLVMFSDVSARVEQQRELEERSAENESLRELARAMSAVPDSEALLHILCDAAMGQCGAVGATVSQLHGDEGEFVAGVGRGESLRGTRFPVAYSLTGEVIAAASTVRRADYDSEAPYVQPVQRHTDGGPAILTPLKANDLVLGVLTVWRDPAAPAFTARDEVRLRVIADHASLALWKARLFEEAQSANHAKNNFLATISHELRTPLTALTGYGELLADEILGPMPKQQQDVIERMRSVTQHLTAMIDEILTFSSLEAGREKVRTTMVSTGDLIRSTVDLLEPIAQQKGLPLHVSAPERAPLVRTDADKVRQILINLAGNAIKFTARGSVHLSLDNGGGSVRFSVRDTGVGISEEDQARLFKPFTQLDSGLTRQHGGTGLGLYISHRLATLLGGRIDVESVPGNGSTFTLVLPV